MEIWSNVETTPGIFGKHDFAMDTIILHFDIIFKLEIVILKM